MKEAIYMRPPREWSRHERLVHRFENLLCRLGIHAWEDWYQSMMFGGEARMCSQCTRYETRHQCHTETQR